MFNKLKHEWKTVAWGLASGALELWDQVLSSQLYLVAPMVPEQHQWMVHVAIPIGFFVLRQWKNKDVDSDT